MQIQSLRLKNFYQIIKKSNGEKGQPLPNMTQYFLADDAGNLLSFWNDLPLRLNKDTVSCCIQVPKEISAKYQVAKDIKFHPFMQDTRKNLFSKELQLRYYAQFPVFNYGFIPQTWEQNIVKDSLGLYGDDDPIDICELSTVPKKIGSIFDGKILGSFCLIDQGQVDWKILVLDVEEAQDKKIRDYRDISKEHIASTMNWFKGIKVFDGKKPNIIAYDEKIFDKEETIAIIKQTNSQWVKLMKNKGEVYDKIRKNYHLQ